MNKLRLQLLSDGTFGRGDGVSGLVDDEIDYDLDTGLPYIKGRTIKGLLVEECSNFLFSVDSWGNSQRLDELRQSAQRLFGAPGSTLTDEGNLHFGEARLHEDIIRSIFKTLQSQSSLTPQEVLEALTGIRRRSAMDESTEAPRDETLRSARVLMRKTEFFVPLVELEQLTAQDWQLLAACAAGLMRGGKNRNRGAGALLCQILDEQDVDQTTSWSDQLLTSIPEGAAQ